MRFDERCLKPYRSIIEIIKAAGSGPVPRLSAKYERKEGYVMKEKENRFSVWTTGKRQAEIPLLSGNIMQNNSTIVEPKKQYFTFEKILPKGAEHGISAAELLRMTGLSDTRVIRKLIADERAAGAVILSGMNGYYLPDDGEKGRRETEAYIAAMGAKGISTLRAIRSAKAYLANLPGQIEIGNCDDEQP